MAFCLLKPLAESFKKALREGKINPQVLANMASENRRAVFEEYVGKDASEDVNALFESKLILKDVQQGMINWAKQITGIKPEVRRGMIERIQKLDERILNPVNEKAFLEDLASKRLGVEVTLEEAREIARLSKNLADAKANLPNNRLAYGTARTQLENFMREKKQEAQKISLEDFKANPMGVAVQSAGKIGGIAKSLKASLDVSALGRQGFKAIFAHPKQWGVNAAKTFKDIFDTLARKTSDDFVMDALRSEIYSRPNSTNGLYDRMKLDIGTGEEAYPSSLPEKIPALGRVFKASEVAYGGFLTRLRADIADKYAAIAEANGIDLNNKMEAESIGALVNSLTGRGNAGLGKLGEPVNSLFFSPKSFQANLDFLLLHPTQKMSKFARIEAAKNLLKVLGGIVAILAIARAVWPDSIETDPRSADFGKIKIGDTRFDVTGGMSSIPTLVARLATMSSKSSVSGAISELGSEYGQKTGSDVFLDFAGNKLSPVASVGRDVLNRSDREGNPLTLKGTASNLLMPLPVSNALSTLENENSAPKLLTILADAFGIATNTYSDKSTLAETLSDKRDLLKTIRELSNTVGTPVSFTNWDTSTAKDIADFKEKSGEDKFGQAKRWYNSHVQDEIEKALNSDTFKKWSNEDKVRYLNSIDSDIKEKTFSQFGFKKPKLPKKKELKL